MVRDRFRSDRTPIVKAIKQGREIGDVADFLAKRISVDFLLEDGPHPVESILPGLRSPIGLRGKLDHSTRIAEKLLRASWRNNGRVGAGEQEQEVDRALPLK
jgi:hypothetical protein